MADNFQEKVDFIWSVANLLRGDYKQSEYQKVILPLTVLRRLDCVTEPTKDEVLQKYEELEDQGVENVAPALERVSGQNVYNTSEYTFEKLCEEPEQIDPNLRYYINSFDDDTQEVLEKFDFGHQIDRLEDADLLYQVVRKFREIDLHPDEVPNEEMGYIYEELIRKFSELSNETAGEHFTPREVIRLMVNLIFNEDDDVLTQPGVVRTLYDPACGTGGMLSIAEDYIRGLNQEANLHVYGQELNPESYAVCNSDMLIKGQDPDNIVYGNSFSNDGFPSRNFDYMLSNPPFGVSWDKVEDVVKQEHEQQGFAGRFGAGTPRKSDGSLLFLQHMLSKMKPQDQDGSRIAIVFNGSPLFSGGANSGESAIRRWIIENDWLEAIVGLPDKLFYNTDIHTYIWILSNNKSAQREGKVQLIDGRDLYENMRKNLGDKSNKLNDEHISKITSIFGEFEKGGRSKIVANEEFGYRRIVIDRPLRLSFSVTPEKINLLDEERAFSNREDEKQEAIKDALGDLSQEKVWKDRKSFHDDLERIFDNAGISVTKSVIGNIENVLGERDPDAEICRDSKGEPEYDLDLRSNERIPLGEDPYDYFKREVEPHVPNAWINEESKRYDDKDGELGVVGYEINFERQFYQYEPPRSLEEIDQDIEEIEEEIVELLEEVV
ncbi:type I restriction-modification system subunit M [Salarchaeum japonicum]|uniref:type I restriction-modification system subunit M n=1 Tax=Salarchaeum japonicum TaxID=555573 RepID=UPI003C733665